MDVLVTGGTGFVGSNLCRELVDRGHDVTALARSPEDADLPDDVDVLPGDVTTYRSIEDRIDGRDAVVNLVALSPLFKPRGGSRMHDRVHRIGTENVVKAMQQHGVDHLIQLSALGAAPDAATAYLRAKGRAEEHVRQSDVDATIFRPSIFFGEGDEFVTLTRLLTPPLIAPLPFKGDTPFQPLWIEDGVAVIADALEADRHRNQTYDIGGAEELTLGEVGRKAREAQGIPVKVIGFPMPLMALGARIGEALPMFPFGEDQYRALHLDNTIDADDNAVIQEFGYDPAELTTLDEYLGLE